MGLVLRSVEAAADVLPAPLPSFTLAYDKGNSIEGTIASTNGINWLNTSGFNTKGGLIDGNGYAWMDKDKDKERIKRGDGVMYVGHISIVHSEGWGVSQNNGNYDIVHASGTPCTDKKVDGTCEEGAFSRKVLVTKDLFPDMPSPIGFGRLKIWE